MSIFKVKMKNEKGTPVAGLTRLGFVVLTFSFLLFGLGCQQKMADQPAPRPYEASKYFPNNQSARTLEAGTVHRGARAETDPIQSGLSAKGRTVKAADPSAKASNSPESIVPPKGVPESVDNYVTEFPFQITEADLKLGQTRYNTFCAVCHGAAGDGNGKIVERGFLRPPSYHQDPEGKKFDWSTLADPSDKLPQGNSRGFYRWGQKVAIEDVPVGYIFQVITWGYGGMPDHASQISPEDRWRITA
ncbi:MAG: c-type cytochrome, partial [Gemmataceae bacterium]